QPRTADQSSLMESEVDRLTPQLGDVLRPDDPLQFDGRTTEGVQGSDDGAVARTRHAVHTHARSVEGLEGADVRHPTRRPTAEGDTDSGSCGASAGPRPVLDGGPAIGNWIGGLGLLVHALMLHGSYRSRPARRYGRSPNPATRTSFLAWGPVAPEARGVGGVVVQSESDEFTVPTRQTGHVRRGRGAGARQGRPGLGGAAWGHRSRLHVLGTARSGQDDDGAAAGHGGQL